MKEFLHLFVERSSAHNDLFKGTAERIHKPAAYLAVYGLVEQRYSQSPPHRLLRYHGHYLVFVDFFEYQRYGHYQVGTHIAERFHKQLWRRQTAEQSDVRADSKRCEHVERTTVGMCQRKERQHTRSLIMQP